MRTCKCGGIIREEGKPYWDILPSCSCQTPEAVKLEIIVTTSSGTLNEIDNENH